MLVDYCVSNGLAQIPCKNDPFCNFLPKSCNVLLHFPPDTVIYSCNQSFIATLGLGESENDENAPPRGLEVSPTFFHQDLPPRLGG